MAKGLGYCCRKQLPMFPSSSMSIIVVMLDFLTTFTINIEANGTLGTTTSDSLLGFSMPVSDPCVCTQAASVPVSGETWQGLYECIKLAIHWL
ncbi:hypothetical protein XELAEV_18028743mg [Xenopus laevis]|uniref:Uncharacterized protein n=1 Tax=Xenopus laevis TaxID=8355 RepID=A0A974CSN4_XENLA|nr:hypothetical protein XELAEV_18028743mg [Xenopus laevis]